MSPNSFDREIKAKLFAAETDVPDHLWSAVAHSIAPKRKKRWLLWFILPFALALGGSALAFLQYEGENVATDPTPTASPENILAAHTSFESEDEEANVALIEPEQAPDKVASKGVFENTEKIKRTGHIQSMPIKEKDAPLSKDLEIKSLHATQEVAQTMIEDQVSSTPLMERGQETSTSRLGLTTDIYFLPSIQGIAPSFFQSPDPNLKICPSFAAPSRFKPFLEFGFSAGLPFRTLEERSQEMMGYKQNREQTEKVRSSLALQALVGVEINSQFEVKSGIGLTKIYEVFDYVDETATRTTTSTTVDTIRDLGGNIVAIRIDTSVTTEYGQRIKLSQNRYTFLNVPVLAAYKFKVRDHQFFVQGGAIFNLALKTRGDIRSPEDKIQSIDTDNSETPTIFRKNSGIELTGSVGYELEMSERTSLRFSATYRHALEDMTLADYPLGQRYKHIHLGVSLKHNLK